MRPSRKNMHQKDDDVDATDAQNDLIVAIVKKGFNVEIVNAAKDAGAQGATTILGRGAAYTIQRNY